jgi:hypothetical protein
VVQEVHQQMVILMRLDHQVDGGMSLMPGSQGDGEVLVFMVVEHKHLEENQWVLQEAHMDREVLAEFPLQSAKLVALDPQE